MFIAETGLKQIFQTLCREHGICRFRSPILRKHLYLWAPVEKSQLKKLYLPLNQLNIKATTESILKRIFIFTISSFGFIVEQIFERPFAFQFFDISANALPNDEWEVVAIISGREQ